MGVVIPAMGDKVFTREELIEALSGKTGSRSLSTSEDALPEYAHDVWSRWMRHLFSKSKQLKDGTVTIPEPLVKQWRRQVATPYSALSEKEKKSDKAEAATIIRVLKSRGGRVFEAVDLSRVIAAKKAEKLIKAGAGKHISQDKWHALNTAAKRPRLRSRLVTSSAHPSRKELISAIVESYKTTRRIRRKKLHLKKIKDSRYMSKIMQPGRAVIYKPKSKTVDNLLRRLIPEECLDEAGRYTVNGLHGDIPFHSHFDHQKALKKYDAPLLKWGKRQVKRNIGSPSRSLGRAYRTHRAGQAALRRGRVGIGVTRLHKAKVIAKNRIIPLATGALGGATGSVAGEVFVNAAISSRAGSALARRARRRYVKKHGRSF